MPTSHAHPSSFDERAKTWDANSTTRKTSELFVQTIGDYFPALTAGKEKDKRALEIGCGTGLLSMQLAPLVREYYAFDPSRGMIDALNAKLAQPGAPTNLHAIAEIFDDPACSHLAGQKVDYIFAHLTLHHVPDLKETISHLVEALSPGGHVVFSDFELAPHSEEFHPKEAHADVHRHGIDAQEMRELLVSAGLVDVRVERSFQIDKAGDDPVWNRRFGFLICVGRKV